MLRKHQLSSEQTSAGQLGNKDTINTSVLEKGRVKEVCLPDEMDHLSHWAVFIAVKAKRNTGQHVMPRF